MSKVVVFGISQWAELAHFYLTHDSPHEVVAFTLDRDYIESPTYKDLPVVPFDEVEQHYDPAEFKMFIPMSFKRMNHVRAEKYYDARKKGYELISYVSSKATTFPGFECGDNCFILEDNTVQPFVSVGNDVTLWSGNHIGHDSIIEDHCFITSHVVVSGHVRIGTRSFLGVNATLRNAITIAPESLIVAGAVITKNTTPKGVYYPERAKRAPKLSDEIEL